MNYAVHTKLQDSNWELSSKWTTFAECKKIVKKMRKGALGESCMYQITDSIGRPVDDNGDVLPSERQVRKAKLESMKKADPFVDNKSEGHQIFKVNFLHWEYGAGQATHESLAILASDEATVSSIVSDICQQYGSDAEVLECVMIYEGDVLESREK